MTRRIDRLLRGDVGQPVSGPTRAALAFGCAAVILAVVACRQVEPEAAPLKAAAPLSAEQQAEREASQARWNELVEFEKAAREMTPQQVADAEAAWRKNPGDRTTLEKLLIYYGRHSPSIGNEQPASDGVVDAKEIGARRALVLWLIANDPDAVPTGQSDRRVYTIDPRVDPIGYEQGRKLWLSQLSRPDLRAPALDHAATFFESTEPALAEELLTRAEKVDPGAKTLFANGEPMHWDFRVADLYCQAFAGSDEARHSMVRARLAASQDAELLARVGFCLWRAVPPTAPTSVELVALAKSYFERARQLSPQSEQARAGLVWLDVRDRDLRMIERLKEVPLEKEYEAVSRLPEYERLEFVLSLADRHYMKADGVNGARPDGAPATHYARSKQYALDALALARNFPDDPIYGTVIYRANVNLGLHALREGDREEAVRHMLAAITAPSSEELAWSGSPLQRQLSYRLLSAGERDSVATFYERSAALRMFSREREQLLKDAAAIRAGVMPTGYQATMAG